MPDLALNPDDLTFTLPKPVQRKFSEVSRLCRALAKKAAADYPTAQAAADALDKIVPPQKDGKEAGK